jgi:hypothetical protein
MTPFLEWHFGAYEFSETCAGALGHACGTSTINWDQNLWQGNSTLQLPEVECRRLSEQADLVGAFYVLIPGILSPESSRCALEWCAPGGAIILILSA